MLLITKAVVLQNKEELIITNKQIVFKNQIQKS